MPLCLAAGAVTAVLAADAFTLAWTHSIEKILWEEDWQVQGRTLVLTEARVRGTGAGMEPPAEAQFRDGAWHYRPRLPPLPELQVRQAPEVEGYRLCVAGRCRPLAELLAGAENESLVRLLPCTPKP